MSHEALHNTKIEYDKQKKAMEDIDLAISKLEQSRDKEQKILDSKRTKKVELETNIATNIQDQKKDHIKEVKDKLVEDKKKMEAELVEIIKDISIYTPIVEDYNQKIQKLKKNKDIIAPKLSSAKKESIGEKVGHFMKKNWAALAASTILAGGMVGAYEYGKHSAEKTANKSDNDKKPSTEKVVEKKDTSKDNIKVSTTDSSKISKDTTANYQDGIKTQNDKKRSGNSNRQDQGPSKEKKNKTPRIIYKITNPNGTKDTTFNKKEERDNFIKDHNLILHEKGITNSVTPKVEWKLTSPDGKQTKTFATKEERDIFAKEHNLQINE